MKFLIHTLLFFSLCNFASAESSAYDKFFGTFTGQVEISDEISRNLEVQIKPIDKGFNVSWKTIVSDKSGSGKTKSYSIDFISSQREGIYGSAMKTNLFGGQQALDPMKGEPYFWAKVADDTLTIYDILIDDNGRYEVQRYDRTINGDEMTLVYTLSKDNKVKKSITALLMRN